MFHHSWKYFLALRCNNKDEREKTKFKLCVDHTSEDAGGKLDLLQFTWVRSTCKLRPLVFFDLRIEMFIFVLKARENRNHVS